MNSISHEDYSVWVHLINKKETNLEMKKIALFLSDFVVYFFLVSYQSFGSWVQIVQPIVFKSFPCFVTTSETNLETDNIIV